MQGRDNAQADSPAHLPLTQHAYAKSKVLAVCRCNPLVSCPGVDISVVGKSHPLVVQPDEKSVMEAALVDKGLVLHAPPLSLRRREDAEQ